VFWSLLKIELCVKFSRVGGVVFFQLASLAPIGFAQQSVLRNQNTREFALFASLYLSVLNTKKDIAFLFLQNDILNV
jgi:hypothetical protein